MGEVPLYVHPLLEWNPPMPKLPRVYQTGVSALCELTLKPKKGSSGDGCCPQSQGTASDDLKAKAFDETSVWCIRRLVPPCLR